MWFDTLLKRACYREESAKSRELHNNVGYVGAWVNFLRGLSGLRGSKYIYLGHNFCVGQIYFCVGL